MVQLHATWLPPSLGLSSGLFLWGVLLEDEGDLEEISEDREHPSAIPARGLRSLLRDLGDGLLYECSEEQTLQILWPTEGDVPAPPGASGRLEWWRVPGLRVPPQDCPQFLAEIANATIKHVEWGTSLLYWRTVARFCLRLIAGRSFVPTLTPREASGRAARAVWRPVFLEEADEVLFETLAAVQPKVCLAWRPDRDPGIDDHTDRDAGGAAKQAGAVTLVTARSTTKLPHSSPRLLLQSFLDTVLDMVLRLRLAEAGFPDRGRRRRARHQAFSGPLGSWFRALAWIDSRVELTSAPVEEFAAAVRLWSRPLVAAEPGGYRIGFALQEPTGDAGSWSLEIRLETAEEPTQSFPLRAVWTNPERTLRAFDQTFPEAQERTLLDIHRAARIFSPVGRALEEIAPESCVLELEEAHRFLTQGARDLTEAGFGIELPEWWANGGLRPELRLILDPIEDSGSSNGADGAGRTGVVAGLLEYRWEVAIGSSRVSPDEFSKLVDDKRPLVRLHGQWVVLDSASGRRIRALFEERDRNPRIGIAKALRLGLGGAEGLSSLPTPTIEASGWIAELLDRLRGVRSPEAIAPGPEFHGTLRPYQERGVGWLNYLEQYGFGACLADDMGLGKTVQLIALLLHERRTGGSETAPSPGPTLVLCPMSVVGNWQREIQRFAPTLRVMVHHGLQRLRDASFTREASSHDVVVSTYALTRRDAHLFHEVPWHRIVLDEAQNIKNPTTQQSKAVRKLEAPHRAALTGTPLENRLSELWSIFDFLNPGYLGTHSEFRRRFEKPIERDSDQASRKLLHELTRPFLLRRVKTDPEVVRDLPEKLEMRVFCNLTQEQAGLYQAIVDEMMQRIDAAQGISRRGLILATLTRLKQICNHPAHYLQDGSAIAGRSGKVERLAEMLEEILSINERALCFTQFVEMGLALESHLAERLGIRTVFLHGGTPQKERDRMVEEFQSETPEAPSVFILSVRAGGTGLNLTAANHVFHFDRWWNPAVENQATDRAFRIGQRRNVQVHKFVCVGTLEERIDQIIEEKRHIADIVLGSGEQWLTELSTENLREVLTLSRDAVSES